MMLDGGESKVASEDDLKSSLHLRTSDEIESLMMFAYQALHSPFSNKLYQFCQGTMNDQSLNRVRYVVVTKSPFRHIVFMARRINDKDDSIFMESFPSRRQAESFARALNSPASGTTRGSASFTRETSARRR
ncbi:protein of unknown function [Thauera humireducens]|nr:protein of unknown function [Thauera humireducens]